MSKYPLRISRKMNDLVVFEYTEEIEVATLTIFCQECTDKYTPQIYGRITCRINCDVRGCNNVGVYHVCTV